MINTLSKINLSKIGWEGGRSTSIWIMSLNILVFFGDYPLQLFSFHQVTLINLLLIFVPTFLSVDVPEEAMIAGDDYLAEQGTIYHYDYRVYEDKEYLDFGYVREQEKQNN